VGVSILIRSRQPLEWPGEQRTLRFDGLGASSISEASSPLDPAQGR